MLWTLKELVEHAAARLEGGAAVNGRIKQVPDARLVRYYTTLGLLDRPSAFEGRTALYGLRHLQQLLAIKKLQHDGLSLVDIQARLTGVDDQELARLAELHAPPPPRPRQFWKQAPAPLAPPAELKQVLTLAPNVQLMVPAGLTLDPAAIAAAAAPLVELLQGLEHKDKTP